MEDSKVVRLMKCLSHTELNEFGRYINSDFFNRKKRMRQFVKVLIAAIKGKRAFPEKIALHQKLFPDGPKYLEGEGSEKQEVAARKEMDLLIFQLKTHLEDYLIWKEGQEKGLSREKVLLSAFQRRNADTHFFDLYNRMSGELSSQKHQPMEANLELHILNHIANEHSGRHRWVEAGKNLGDIMNPLDTYYMTSKLIHTWLILLADFMNNQPSKVQMVDEVLALSRMTSFQDNPIIESYRRVIEDIRERKFTAEGLRYLKDRILPSFEERGKKERRGYFNLLMNYGVLLGQFSKENSDDERFELYQMGTENGYFIRNGEIGYADFHNIVCMAENTGNFVWADQFIDKYGPLLPEEIRETQILEQKARIRLSAGDPATAVKYLDQSQSFVNPKAKALVSIMRIRCYYMLREDDLFENSLEATRKQIERNPGLSDSIRDLVRAFLKHTRRLYLARQSDDPVAAIRPTHEELLNGEQKPVAYLWLLSEVEKLAQ